MPEPHRTCLVVEPEQLMLDLLSSSLALRGGLRVIAQRADQTLDLRASCEQHRPDILLVEIPSVFGSDVQQMLADVVEIYSSTVPDGSIILLGGADEEFERIVIPRGIRAVVGRGDSFDVLRQALDDILDGPEARRTRHGPSFRSKSLSERESEVFALIGEGLTTREIAERLSLSAHTVQVHRRRIAKKLGTRRDELSHRVVASRRMFYGQAAAANEPYSHESKHPP